MRYYSLKITLLATGMAMILFCNASDSIAADASQLADLRKGAVAWNAMRTTTPSVLPDLSKADLKGRRLRSVNFRKANLSEANLSLSDLGQSDFQEADLRSARLDGAALSGCRFNDAEMSAVTLQGSSCVKSDFSRVKLTSSVLRRADLSRAILSGADLRGSDMRESVLVSADLRGADLRGANLWRANDGGVLLDGAIISEETILPSGKHGSPEWAVRNRAVFKTSVASAPATASSKSTAISEPSLPEKASGVQNDVRAEIGNKQDSPAPSRAITLPPVKAWQANQKNAAYDAGQLDILKSNALKWNRMRRTQPSLKVNLREADLDHKNLAYADLRDADLAGATLRYADLSHSDLRKAILQGADLREANLNKADLREVDLRGATLWRANTDQARFDGAIVSINTVLDTGRKASQAWADGKNARFTQDDLPAK